MSGAFRNRASWFRSVAGSWIVLFIFISSLAVEADAIPIEPSQLRPSPLAIQNDSTNVWRKTDPEPYTAPVDNTLLIVGPIAAGIILMVFAFFFYVFSDGNAAAEGFDYQDLSNPLDVDADNPGPGPAPDAPSTSAAAFQI